MSSTKKGNKWYFGMKAHIGVKADSGVILAKIGGGQLILNELAALRASLLDRLFPGVAVSRFDAAVALTRREQVEQEVMVPFELVAPDNMAEYAQRN